MGTRSLLARRGRAGAALPRGGKGGRVAVLPPLRPGRRRRRSASGGGAWPRARPAGHAGDEPPGRNAARAAPRGPGGAARADRERRGVPRGGARPPGRGRLVSLSDTTLARLAEMLDAPDLAGTKYELRGPVGPGGVGTVWPAFDRARGAE